VDLLRRFGPDLYKRALEDWSWLMGGRQAEPVAASPFGDLFLQAADGVWFLDLLEGTFTMQWPDLASLQSALSTPEGHDELLMAGLALAADSRGVTPGEGEVLAFKIPPVLGGAIDIDNLETMGYVVASSIAGQLHRQVKDLPAGTTISGFSLSDENS